MQIILSETNQKLIIQGELVSNLRTQVLNTQSMLEKKDNQLNAQKNATISLQKSLKKQRRHPEVEKHNIIINRQTNKVNFQ